MSARRLRWLSPLGFLGLLQFPLHESLLAILYGFFVFGAFFGAVVDERSEANLGRAASFTYLATLVVLMAGFLVPGVFFGGASDHTRIAALALSLVAIYVVHVMGFVISYVYFDARGR
jgi:hypothetical protein